MLGEAPIPGSPLRPDPCTRAMGGAASPWKSGVRGRGAAWLRWSFTPGPCAQKPESVCTGRDAARHNLTSAN